MATEADPPLYLHIAATTQEILDKGIKAVQELIAQEPPSLENPTRMPERSNMPERVSSRHRSEGREKANGAS